MYVGICIHISTSLVMCWSVSIATFQITHPLNNKNSSLPEHQLMSKTKSLSTEDNVSCLFLVKTAFKYSSFKTSRISSHLPAIAMYSYQQLKTSPRNSLRKPRFNVLLKETNYTLKRSSVNFSKESLRVHVKQLSVRATSKCIP